jgi:hypothetical protein
MSNSGQQAYLAAGHLLGRDEGRDLGLLVLETLAQLVNLLTRSLQMRRCLSKP